MFTIDSNLGRIIGSIILGAGTAAWGVQVFVFFTSLFMGLAGYMRERVFSKKYLFVFIKSVTGLIICAIVFWLAYIIADETKFDRGQVNYPVFFGVGILTVIAFLFHIVNKLKRIKDLVDTSEFDDIHRVDLHTQGIDDYVKKNLELLKTLQEKD